MIVTRQTALFLDYDGTLVDLAATPEAAVPGPCLVDLLHDLGEALGGALAILSGRTVSDLDSLLTPLQLTIGGVHGAEVRVVGTTLQRREPPAELSAVRQAAHKLADDHPGIRVEDKGPAVAVHYRANPDVEKAVEAALHAALGRTDGIEMIHGKMVFEVRARDMHKGAVLEHLMQHRLFRDRKPVMIGDDRTDEDAFARVIQLGGKAIKVGTGQTLAQSRLSDPSDVITHLQDALATMKDLR
ncbi:MAG: trehalose-phosphatase [Minwuia sp.]|nr:trehalose-phosphatase [Minwuia sp.]